jgi:hypothetical protein
MSTIVNARMILAKTFNFRVSLEKKNTKFSIIINIIYPTPWCTACNVRLQNWSVSTELFSVSGIHICIISFCSSWKKKRILMSDRIDVSCYFNDTYVSLNIHLLSFSIQLVVFIKTSYKSTINKSLLGI